MTCPHEPKFARDMCSACYQRARRAGELEPKKPALRNFVMRLPQEVRELAEASAQRAGQTLATWVRTAVEQRLLREQAAQWKEERRGRKRGSRSVR